MGEGASGTPGRDTARAVLEALRAARIDPGSEVNVRATGGVVSLYGAVGNHRQKLQAERVAAAVPGVRAVVNELRVVPQVPRSDDQVASDVRAAVAADPRCATLRVEVQVQDGAVFLVGEAGSLRERAAAEECAWSVRGVREVHNVLTIGSGLHPSDAELAREIATQLTHCLGLAERQLEVSVHHGVAYLLAIVPTADHRWRAEEAARWHREVVGVVNQLEVVRGQARVSQLPPGTLVTLVLLPNISPYHNASPST
ncbi:MAG: BON domain-containing protein [Chloroflexi bacterium]|nr:BON domain-containing protein [Chloroflexota bacterium]